MGGAEIGGNAKNVSLYRRRNQAGKVELMQDASALRWTWIMSAALAISSQAC